MKKGLRNFAMSAVFGALLANATPALSADKNVQDTTGKTQKVLTMESDYAKKLRAELEQILEIGSADVEIKLGAKRMNSRRKELDYMLENHLAEINSINETIKGSVGQDNYKAIAEGVLYDMAKVIANKKLCVKNHEGKFNDYAKGLKPKWAYMCDEYADEKAGEENLFGK